MGTEACPAQSVKEENLISISKVVEANDVISPPARPGSPIGPRTPNSNGELQGHEFLDHQDGNSSETPKDTLFDSFTLCPDNLIQHKKCNWEESRIHVFRRRVDFTLRRDNITSHESIFDEEDHLFEIVYGTILDAIVSEQTKEIEEVDGFRTPKSAPRLSWIAGTCPGTPMKSARKCRILDKEICKKLEF